MFNAAVSFFGCDSYTVIAGVNAIKVGTEKRKKVENILRIKQTSCVVARITSSMVSYIYE